MEKQILWYKGEEYIKTKSLIKFLKDYVKLLPSGTANVDFDMYDFGYQQGIDDVIVVLKKKNKVL